MARAFRRGAALPVAAILSLVLAGAAGEIAVRSFSLAPPIAASSEFVSDPFGLYRPRPLSQITVTTDEFTYVRRHNGVGFRDVDHSPGKVPGVFRILGLGDSFTYGTGVELEQTFLYRLEAMLNARTGAHPRVEIIKAGVPGYFPEAERLLMERYGMLHAPDLVLVAFVPNDIIDTYKGLGGLLADDSGFLITREAAQLGRSTRALVRHSSLARLLVSRYLQRRIEWAYRQHGDDVYVADGFHEADWRTVEAEYARMMAIADASHARFALVHVPQIGPWKPHHAYPADRLSAWSRKHGGLFVDTLPAMAAAPARLLYYPRDGHCTAEGHEVIARSIFMALTAAGYVP